MSLSCLSVGLAWVFLAPVVQEPTVVPTPRMAVLGSVHGADDAPWANAKVTLFSPDPVPALGCLGDDTVEAVTNERGSFRAMLLRDRQYAAIAVRGGEDSKQFTQVARVVTRDRPRLVGIAETPGSVRVQLLGWDEWRRAVDARLFLVDALGRCTLVAPTVDATFDVPATVGTYAIVEVQSGSGAILFAQGLSLLPSQRTTQHANLEKQRLAGIAGAPLSSGPDLALQPLPPPEVERLVLPPFVHARFRVVAATTGQPLAGATLTRLHRGPFHAKRGTMLATQTDAAGMAEIGVPRSVDGWGRPSAGEQLAFRVAAPGHETRVRGFAPQPFPGFVPLEIQEGGASQVLAVELSPGFALRGRVAGIGAGEHVRLAAMLPDSEVPAVATLDASGVFAFAGIGSKSHCFSMSMHLVVEAKTLGRLFGEAAAGMPFAATRLPLNPPENAVTDVARDYGLADLRLFDLQLVLPDGSPASGARVDCRADDERVLFCDDEVTVLAVRHADKQGRCRLLAPSPRCVVMVETDGHWRVETLEAREPVLRAKLVLAPYPIVRGRVVDDRGQPIAGAQLLSRGTSFRHIDRMVNFVARVNGPLLRATADQSGRFELRFLPWAAIHHTLFVAAPAFAPFEPADLILDQPPETEVEVVLRRQAEPVFGK